MCKHTLHDLVAALPKCEHHIHLEGALTPELLFDLADKNCIDLPENDPAFSTPVALKARYNQFSCLDDFLGYYYVGMSVLVKSEDFEALAWSYFQRAKSEGVMHAEVFFDPQAHLPRGVSYDTVLTGFLAAKRRAEELDITSELICCFLRHLPVQDCLSTFQLPEVQASYASGQIIGIGLDSSEKPFPPGDFKAIYEQAQALGLRRTAHAGEEGPADYILSALDVLDMERIDHGIHLVDDSKLLKRVADQGILLSVCPLSNVLLRCVSSVDQLPIREFLNAGVNFSINSDDPAYFGGHYILDNYCAVQEAFDLSATDWQKICEGAIRGSWCSEARKQSMLARLETVLAKGR